mmetsp:Transcript_807/g.796  ORF Transcript_807/g.796 Transcript_807/m.796 type:complete len:81 (+) Transcript_807:542-784(+)
MHQGSSIASVIIVSVTIAAILGVLLNTFINYFASKGLEAKMKYYCEKNLEHEAFISLPLFNQADNLTSCSENSIEIVNDS